MKKALMGLAFSTFLFLSQCSNISEPSSSIAQDNKSIRIAIKTQPHFKSIAGRAIVNISAYNMNDLIKELQISDTMISGTIDVPIGSNRLFEVFVYSQYNIYDTNASLIYYGSATSDIGRGHNFVHITLTKDINGSAEIIGTIEDTDTFDLPYDTLPYDTLPYDTLPYDTLPYDTLPYDTLPYDTLPYDTLPYDTLPYDTLPYDTLPYDTLPYDTLPYDTLPYLYQIQSKTMSFKVSPSDTQLIDFSDYDSIYFKVSGNWCIKDSLCTDAYGFSLDSTFSRNDLVSDVFPAGALLGTMGEGTLMVNNYTLIGTKSLKKRSIILTCNRFKNGNNDSESGFINVDVFLLRHVKVYK